MKITLILYIDKKIIREYKKASSVQEGRHD
jgi:hypothetical protein